jgi:OmpA-OmpF porin, OOP family
MRKFTKLLLVFAFMWMAVAVHAQSADTTQSAPKAEPALTSPPPAGPAANTAVDTNKAPVMAEPAAPVSSTPAASAPADTTVPMGVPAVTSQPDSTPRIAGPADSAQVASDTSKAAQKKDIQNQVQFFAPDMESKTYNFYQRKEISQPLMPRYDLDSAVYQRGKKKEQQQQKFLARQYAFPARPKDQWELGLNIGTALLSGNVKPYITGPGIFENVGGGFTIRKALGYFFSLRGGYNFMMMTGRDYQPNENLEFNQALNGTINPNVNYYSNPNLLSSKTAAGINMNHLFFYNYRAWVHEAHLEGVFNIGNINFHRERNYVNFYLLGGISGFFFTTYMDALDKNGNVYDFSKVDQLYQTNNNNNVNSRIQNQRKEALKLLNQIYNGGYTVLADHENNKPGIKNWEFDPSASAGIGVQFHISKWVTLGIEERVIFTQAHVDGYRWQQDEHPALVSHYDNISYTSINVNIHLGGKKRTEPLYWLNPVYHTYRKLGEVDPQSLMEQMFKDDDDDGVPNYLDREPNTKKGCPVDAHGVALDSDHDGIIDCLDKEPFSPPGYPIDSNGVAIIPPNPCCDTTGRAWLRENMNNPVGGVNGTNGANGQPGVNGQNGENVENGGLGGAGKRKGNAGYDCSKIELPAVMFDQDKYYLDPQYYGNLHQVAERMQMCPDMKLVVTGYDESRNDQKYNEQLGWNRANAAVDYLVEKYGISRDRFIIKYQGGKKAAEGTPFEKKLKNKVEFRYSNEGENGDSNPPAPHPGLKAGSNK